MSSKRLCAILLCLMLVVLHATGCEPFRKKFVRKKKEQKERFIPVLDPIEYPAKVYSAEDEYKRSYSLWKVWSSDFVKSLEENENDKKQKYNLAQSLKALEGLKGNVNDENKSRFDGLISQLNELNSEYEKAVNMRSVYQMKSRMEKMMSQVRNELSPKAMANQFVQ